MSSIINDENDSKALSANTRFTVRCQTCESIQGRTEHVFESLEFNVNHGCYKTTCLDSHYSRIGQNVSWPPPPLTNATARTHIEANTGPKLITSLALAY